MKNNKGENMFLVQQGHVTTEMILFIGAFILLVMAALVYIMKDQTNSDQAIKYTSEVKGEITQLSLKIDEWQKSLESANKNISEALQNQGEIKTYFDNAQHDLREQNAKIRTLEIKVKSQDEKIMY